MESNIGLKPCSSLMMDVSCCCWRGPVWSVSEDDGTTPRRPGSSVHHVPDRGCWAQLKPHPESEVCDRGVACRLTRVPTLPAFPGDRPNITFHWCDGENNVFHIQSTPYLTAGNEVCRVLIVGWGSALVTRAGFKCEKLDGSTQTELLQGNFSPQIISCSHNLT